MSQGVDRYKTTEAEWYGEGYTREVSRRQYIEVQEVRGVQVTEYDYAPRRAETVDVTLYLDPETGLVVYDVAAYEKWIGA